MNVIIEKFTKAFDQYTAERFIDALFESILISLIITFFLWARKGFFFKHKLNPINACTIDMVKVEPTVSQVGIPSIGFDTKVKLRIQNVGNKPAEDLRITYMLKQIPPLAHGLNYFDRNLQHLYPGDVADFTFNYVLNIKNADNVSSHSFLINVLLTCKRGAMTYYEMSIFKNFGHDSIQSVNVSNIKRQNRFNSYVIRKLTKYHDKSGIKGFMKLIGIKDEFINGYKLILQSQS